MPAEREPSGARAEASQPEPLARPLAPGPLAGLQHAIGNAAMGRLLSSDAGAQVLRTRRLSRWELDPSMFIKRMDAPAERETDGPTHRRLPDKLEPGDHVWYYPHPDPKVQRIYVDQNVPRDIWFKGSTDELDFQGHGNEIRNFVVYPGEVREGKPQMTGGKGSMAWLNNNPGNLTHDGNDHGQFAGKLNWHGFLIFPDQPTGYAAIYTWLQKNGYWPRSILETISRYAPAGDGKNKPEKYAQDIVDALRGTKTTAGGDATLATTLQELTRDQMTRVQDAIERVEGRSKAGRTRGRTPRSPRRSSRGSDRARRAGPARARGRGCRCRPPA